MMRKNSIALLLLLVSCFTFAQVKWIPLEEALELQKTKPKKILINFYTKWCSPCKSMESSTFGHRAISEYLSANYYTVKFDAEDHKTIQFLGQTFKGNSSEKSFHDFTEFMNVTSVPSTVFLDENGHPITILQGTLSAKELEPYLPFFSENLHLKIKSRSDWENYQKKFKSKIK